MPKLFTVDFNVTNKIVHNFRLTRQLLYFESIRSEQLSLEAIFHRKFLISAYLHCHLEILFCNNQ